MRNSNRIIIALIVALLAATPWVSRAESDSGFGEAPVQRIDGDAASNPQQDQTENSPVLRAFLRGAGYTAPTQGDMICSYNSRNEKICVPSNDVRAYIVTLIRFVLTVVGFLFFALLVYASYLWTTAGGNDDAVKKAQSIATKAIIGFGVILAAWAITTFITRFLVQTVTQ